MTQPGMTYAISKRLICPLLPPIYICRIRNEYGVSQVEGFGVLFSSHSPPGLHVDDNNFMQLRGRRIGCMGHVEFMKEN